MAYQKQTWVNGETVATAERFNHIEDGVYQNSTDITGLNSSVGTNSTDITNLKNSVNTINTTLSGMITKGSNANGNYTKFSDGTLICWGQTGNITTNPGTGTDMNFNLPHQFKDNKYFVDTNYISGNAYFAEVVCFAKPISTSQFRLSTYNRSGAGVHTSDFQWLAIGRWK